MWIDDLLDAIRRQVRERTFRFDRSEFVARAFLDHVGNDKIAPIRRKFGKSLHHPEVGISLGQVECAELLLVGRQAIWIVSVVRLEEAKRPTGLTRVHLLAEASVAEFFVADDVDRANLGEVAFVNLEDNVDAVLVELDDLRVDPRREPALPAIKFENPVDVRARAGSRENLPGASLISGRSCRPSASCCLPG